MQFIQEYPNAFSEDFCSRAIAAFDKSDELGFTVTRQMQGGGVSKSNMSGTSISFTDLANVEKSLSEEFMAVFWGHIFPSYAATFHESINEATGALYVFNMKIQKTDKREAYHTWHYENSTRALSNRSLAWSIYLNEVEGGETEFLYQSLRVKPEMGKAIVFPAGYTHLHRGLPSLDKAKYIITGWVEL